ncbi:hypothetical protein LNKW23_24760 [Paralimibaculum aggregatum]|uniref:Beta-barrel porin 2 n=1 Tax=Paralimibaculum aggregatum TaxID=3036245 RepID=A0ABQ6LPK7_9RHOB|nr:hypothetical protein LNKW23_24760 [Limibaculum sp. NKW23]
MLAALLLLGAPAKAAEWNLGGSFTQRFSVLFNPDIEPDEHDLAYGSTTIFGFNLGARTGRTVWNLSTGFQLAAFGGDADTDDLNTSDPRVSGSVLYLGQRFAVDGNFAFTRSSTAFFTLEPVPISIPVDQDNDGTPDVIFIGEDDLLLERDTIRTRFDIGTGLEYRLNPRNRLSFGLSHTRTSFSEETGSLVDNATTFSSLSWGHDLSQATTVGMDVTLRRFTAQDAEDTIAYSMSMGSFLSTSLSASTTLRAGLGINYSRTDEMVLRDGERVSSSSNDFGFNGSLRTTFRRTDQTAFTLFASHGVRPSSVGGALRNVTSYGGSLNHALTRHTSFALSAQHSLSIELGDEDELTQSFILAPSLSYRLTQNWSASLAYSFRLVNDDDGTGLGNSVFLSFSRGIAIYP